MSVDFIVFHSVSVSFGLKARFGGGWFGLFFSFDILSSVKIYC